MLGGRRDRQAFGCNCRSARTARRIPEIIGRQASRPNLRGMEGAHRKGRGVSSVAARGARPQLSGLFARAMRRQRVIVVPRTTLVRSCIIDGEAVACGGDGLLIVRSHPAPTV